MTTLKIIGKNESSVFIPGVVVNKNVILSDLNKKDIISKNTPFEYFTSIRSYFYVVQKNQKFINLPYLNIGSNILYEFILKIFKNSVDEVQFSSNVQFSDTLLDDSWNFVKIYTSNGINYSGVLQPIYERDEHE